MNKHIVHILHHASKLTKERGMLVCSWAGEGKKEKHELPFEDVEAIIIAARGVFISSELMSALLESNAVILHCDKSYRPVGLTSGLQRIIKPEAAYSQADRDLKLKDNLWKKIVSTKIKNQSIVLQRHDLENSFLKLESESSSPDEAACARYYWQKYFSIFGYERVIRHSRDEKDINSKLDYGYAVMGAFIHRSIIVHGLNPLFGMHHITRYKADALVYDLIEPWRPFVDDTLVLFEKTNKEEDDIMKMWSKKIAERIKKGKIPTPEHQLSIVDAIDLYVSSVAKCYTLKSPKYLWTPQL
jgi:CRISPR-associated protein Cas1